MFSKKLKEDIIFAGGTGQCISILKNKIKDPNQIFDLSDIDLKLRLNKTTDIGKLKYTIISKFIEIINSSKTPEICDISLTIGNYQITSVPVSFYRNIKITPTQVRNFFRFKKTKNHNPFLFDLIELTIKGNQVDVLIFRLFIHLKVQNIKNPEKYRIIQLEILDLSITVTE